MFRGYFGVVRALYCGCDNGECGLRSGMRQRDMRWRECIAAYLTEVAFTMLRVDE